MMHTQRPLSEAERAYAVWIFQHANTHSKRPEPLEAFVAGYEAAKQKVESDSGPG